MLLTLQLTLSECIYIALAVAYLGTVLGIVGVIVSENRDPVKSLGWVCVLLMAPVIGLALYIFFGRSIKNTIVTNLRLRHITLQSAEAYATPPETLSHLSDASMQGVRLAVSLCGAHYYSGNDVEIFTTGADKFARFKADLQAARHYINVQYYIIEDGRIGDEIRRLLIAKAAEGVTVRVIYDGVGSFRMKKSYLRSLRQAGVQAYPFLEVTFPKFAQRVNWRNHRKVAVIDGRTGYIGGMNIADRYVDGVSWGSGHCWRDTHLRITGPAVLALQYSFAADWDFMRHELLTDPVPDFARPASPADGAGVQIITSHPTAQWSNTLHTMLQAIAAAKRRVYLQTPYFLPTESLLKALLTAAMAGVDVRVMMPRRSDSMLLNYASFSYIKECLLAGIRFYLYLPGMLHSKTLVVDDELACCGSTNFDFRSFEHNYEANAMVYSRDINARMRRIFLDDQARCQQCLLQDWARRPLRHRILESTTRLLSPVL